MMRITLDSPALIAVREWLSGSAGRGSQRSGRRSRTGPRLSIGGERLEPRSMLDGALRAMLPDLVASSDTGFSSTDHRTSDRTPAFVGSVLGAAAQVRLVIDGKPGDVVLVEKGQWSYTLPAEKAFSAGWHTIAARPVAASGREGASSNPLSVSVVTAPPTAPTLVLGPRSDTGVKGDGTTTFDVPMLRGVAQPGVFVNVAIDGVVAGRVRSDARSGVWMLQAPRLANGVHDVTAVAENLAGIQSAATGLQVTINGERTVMLDGSDGKTVELKASHLLGQGSQGFIVTGVQRGTLQKWVAAKNNWVTIPASPPPAPAHDPAWVLAAAAIRKIVFTDTVRWTPSRTDVGLGPAFNVIPLDAAGGRVAPTPEAGTVPGRIRNPQIDVKTGFGTSLTWAAPTDGCGCPSTRYSIEVTREDGRTLLYNVASSVTGLSVVEGGQVLRAELWGATGTGAGTKRWHDAVAEQKVKDRLAYTLTSGLSALSLGEKARSQLANSPTPTQFTTSLALGGSHANLAYLQVDAVPDPAEAAQGLPAGTPLIISSDASKLSPKQRADLEANPIYARQLFPGTVNGEVLPDQVRAHFQAGETLQFSGTVDAKVRSGATIVVESAQNLGDGSLGPWLPEARIPVGADGSFSHKYLVPYGMTSVRTRLEYQPQSATPVAIAAAPPALGATSSTSADSTAIDLSGSFNAFGITTAPWQAPNHQGFDGNGNYYNSDYTGSGTKDPVPATPITYKGISFPLGPIPTDKKQVGGNGNSSTNNPYNFVQAKGQTIKVGTMPTDSNYLYLAGAAANGDQKSQQIVLTFTDGSTSTWTQSFHDWASAGPAQQSASTQNYHALLPVIVAATSPVGLYGLQTIDGVALVSGDRVLCLNQNGGKNTVWIASEGSWEPAKDADTQDKINYSYTTVTKGTYAGKTFMNSATSWNATNTWVEGKPPQPTPRPYAGELLLKTEPERINQLGDLVATPAHIFAYCYNLKGKQLASITLPNNSNVGILSAVVAKQPAIALDEGFKSAVLGTTNLTGIDLMALTIANESNLGAGGGPLTFSFADQPTPGSTSSVPLTIATTGATTTQPLRQLPPVKAVATSNIALSGLQTIDGVVLAAGDRVLVQNQSSASANGVYVVGSKAWKRANDANTSAELLGSYMKVVPPTQSLLPVRVVATSNVTLTGAQTIDGVALSAGDRVLVQNQTDATQNGVWIVQNTSATASGAWTRAGDASTATEIEGAWMSVTAGTYAGKTFVNTNTGTLVLGSSAITFVEGTPPTPVSAYAGTTFINTNSGSITLGSTSITFVEGTVGSIATTGGITRDNEAFSGGGFDGNGNAYSWQALGKSRVIRGNSVSFNLGLPDQPNFVVANGQTIPVPQGSSYTTLSLAGAGVNGGAQNQQFTMTFTDGSTAVWTQSLSDWCNPQNYSGEASIAAPSYRDTASGGTNNVTNHIYQYDYTIPSGKTLASITLPTNANVRLLDIQITPPLYTTKDVTVPMGQQQTIAYIAPDSSSQMTFYVQKADGTCVGSTCSTYLTDWNNGSGNKSDWAGSLSPSLNSQMKAGQRWTMTIQNAGEGYDGYLDTPTLSGLPSASGSTPAGAQFKLETQNEINDQPPWAVALETILGEIALMVGVTILTAGTGDAAVIGAEVGADVAAEDATITASASGAIGNEAGNVIVTTWSENLITDSFVAEVMGTGEGGVFFGEGIDVISNVDDIDSILDGSFSEADAAFEGQVEVDVDALQQQQIIEAQEKIWANFAKAGFFS